MGEKKKSYIDVRFLCVNGGVSSFRVFPDSSVTFSPRAEVFLAILSQVSVSPRFLRICGGVSFHCVYVGSNPKFSPHERMCFHVVY